MSVAQRPIAQAAANAALQPYIPGLRRYFAKRVPASDIDDLLQEVFLRMQSQGSDSIEHMGRYLFTVAASVLKEIG